MRCFGLFLLLTTTTFFGCSGKGKVAISPAPCSVSVLKLQETDPARSMMVTGVVDSWKTEDIGFEVSGRVQYVIEPETNVAGPGDIQRDEQPLARIDAEKYETAVESAKAQVNVLTRKKIAAEIERDQVLPSQRAVAVAAQVLAQADYDRAKQLTGGRAISQAEFEQFAANLTTTEAKVVQLDATKAAQSAEITSLDCANRTGAPALKDALRDLDDCTIEAPFRGQIAHVHVIPGGTVQRGETVVTVQMMDPVKVEFEVSAQRVRRMKYKDSLAILLTRADGTVVRREVRSGIPIPPPILRHAPLRSHCLSGTSSLRQKPRTTSTRILWQRLAKSGLLFAGF